MMRIGSLIFAFSFVLSIRSVVAASTAPTSAPTTQPTPPVVYLAHSDPVALSDKALRGILEMASSQPIEGRKVWFLAVVGSDFDGSNVEVFYTPDKTSSRLRTGRFVCVPGFTVVEYAQVSPPAKPFTKELEVPHRADLPFPWPYRLYSFEAEEDALSLKDEELVRLVDVARTLHKPKPLDDPICMIRGGELARRAPGAINVLWGVSFRFGTRIFAVPRAGGIYFQFKRNGDGYRVIDRGTWEVDEEQRMPRYYPGDPE